MPRPHLADKPCSIRYIADLRSPATMIDMAIQRDDTDERQARLELIIEQSQAAEKRSLLKRGIALWTRTEGQRRMVRRDRSLPPEKVN